MDTGGQTPDELATLLEDALLLGDGEAVAALFEPGGLLIADETSPELRGREQISQAATALCLDRHEHLTSPCQVFQARDTALMLDRGAVNVVRRGDDGTWRYAICILSDDGAGPPAATPTHQRPPGTPSTTNG